MAAAYLGTRGPLIIPQSRGLVISNALGAAVGREQTALRSLPCSYSMRSTTQRVGWSPGPTQRCAEDTKSDQALKRGEETSKGHFQDALPTTLCAFWKAKDAQRSPMHHDSHFIDRVPLHRAGCSP